MLLKRIFSKKWKKNGSRIITQSPENDELGIPFEILKICFLVHVNLPSMISSEIDFKLLSDNFCLQIGHTRKLFNSDFTHYNQNKGNKNYR